MHELVWNWHICKDFLMKKLIDLSCFGDAKVWLLYGIEPKQAKAWIKRKFQLDIK